MSQPQPGRIVTFYSYKGGTGRSMALANIAWILASAGQRVLVIDWDLEAPGLHRYFYPFLADPDLVESDGLMDFFIKFAAAAVASDANADKTQEPSWFDPYSNLMYYAYSVDFAFPKPGCLDLVPAGRQDENYSTRVNGFNWDRFYTAFGGGVFLEAVKQKLRAEYEFILIYSRTGVSDTSGICTVQMPDDLIVCFTLNRQSVLGRSAVARSMPRSKSVTAYSRWPCACTTTCSRTCQTANAIGAPLGSAISHFTPTKKCWRCLATYLISRDRCSVPWRRSPAA